MCGFAGIIDFSRAPVELDLLERMSARLARRGPDGQGIFLEGSVGFCHRRLAITDPGPAGAQPMRSPDGRWIIAFNGECYNFRQLRSELETRGCSFRSNTDTEVVLHGLAEHGATFVEKMNGDFAFAAFNRTTREVFLVRDRLGVKPLYWHNDGRRLVFGSTIGALLAAGIKPELEREELRSFLALRYCPGSGTLFRGIEKIRPGTICRISANGEISHSAYWDLRTLARSPPIGFKEAAEEFYSLLEDSVRLRSKADVPVGAFLSGGVDSAVIVALMARMGGSPHTYTLAMGGAVDESRRARAVADELGVGNTVATLGPHDYRRYEEAIFALEEPIGDSIIVPTLLLAEAAGRDVKVVLAGEGADEILGGYVHQVGLTLADRIQGHLPPWANRAAGSLLGKVPLGVWESVFPYQDRMGARGVERVRALLSEAAPSQKYLRAAEIFSAEELDRLLVEPQDGESSRHQHAYAGYWDDLPDQEFQNRLLKLDLKFWAPDYNLLRVDKLSMAQGLEVRVPYFDHRLVELCVRLPATFKTGWLQRKRLLRESIKPARLLSESVRTAPKRSFYLPVGSRFDPQFRELIRDSLSDSSVQRRGWFRRDAVAALRDREGLDLIGGKQLMALFLLETWARLFLDGNAGGR